jgi:uncharacterized protein involved in exopolysaccharide biosynthesis
LRERIALAQEKHAALERKLADIKEEHAKELKQLKADHAKEVEELRSKLTTKAKRPSKPRKARRANR